MSAKVYGVSIQQSIVVAAGELTVLDTASLYSASSEPFAPLKTSVFSLTDFAISRAQFSGSVINWGDGVEDYSYVARNQDGTISSSTVAPHQFDETSTLSKPVVVLNSLDRTRIIPIPVERVAEAKAADLFLYQDFVSADDPILESVFHFTGDTAAYEGQILSFELLYSDGQTTGTVKTDSLQSGLAGVPFQSKCVTHTETCNRMAHYWHGMTLDLSIQKRYLLATRIALWYLSSKKAEHRLDCEIPIRPSILT